MNEMNEFVSKVSEIPPCGVFTGKMVEETRRCKTVLDSLQMGEIIELNLQRKFMDIPVPKHEVNKWSSRCKTAARRLLPKKFTVAIRKTNVYVRRIE